jgi:hypothetical protein
MIIANIIAPLARVPVEKLRCCPEVTGSLMKGKKEEGRRK